MHPLSGIHSRPIRHCSRRDCGTGFSLLELMVVVAIIALCSAIVSLALPNGDHTRLTREAQRLATLLESARVQSRSLGTPVRWLPGPFAAEAAGSDFRFEGLPASLVLPDHWLKNADDPPIGVSMTSGTVRVGAMQLGPEPYIGPQQVTLQMQDQQVSVATDGLGPFAIVSE